METEPAILALAALAQSTRLEAFRLLVRHEPAGLPAGEVANHLAIPANTLSSHLGVLSRAGLIRSERFVLIESDCHAKSEHAIDEANTSHSVARGQRHAQRVIQAMPVAIHEEREASCPSAQSTRLNLEKCEGAGVSCTPKRF